MCKYSALKRYSLLWISFFCWTTWNEYCLFDGLHFSIWKTCHRFILNFYCVANNKSGKILTLPKLIWIGLCEFATFGHLSYSWKQICSSSFRLDWFYWCKAFFLSGLWLGHHKSFDMPGITSRMKPILVKDISVFSVGLCFDQYPTRSLGLCQILHFLQRLRS